MIGTADAAARVPMPIAGDSRDDTNGPRTNPPDHAPVLLDACAHANNHPVSVPFPRDQAWSRHDIPRLTEPCSPAES